MLEVYDVWHHLFENRRFRPSTCKRKAGVFKNLQSEERFWKDAFSVTVFHRIRVDGRPNWTKKISVKQKQKELFHSRDQHLCKFMGTKESVYRREEFNSQRIGLEHQYGRRFIVLEHQYGRRDVRWKRSIRLDGALVKQNNNSARVSRFFVHFLAVTARLRRENWEL